MDKEYTVVFTPLMIEAEPIIRAMNAKRSKISKDYPAYESLDGKFLIIVCGVGQDKAIKAFEKFYNNLIIKKVFLTGIAGALKNDFNHGDLVLVNKISSLSFSKTGEPFAVNDILNTSGNELFMRKFKELESKVKVNFKHGSMITADRFINGKNMKAQVNASTGADIVDMEAYKLCKLVKSYNLPFYCMKVISDVGDEYVDPAINLLFDKLGDIKVGGIVKFLFSKPSKIIPLIKFFMIFRKFQSSIFVLARFLKEAC